MRTSRSGRRACPTSPASRASSPWRGGPEPCRARPAARGAQLGAGGLLDGGRLARRAVGEVVQAVAVDLVGGDVAELHGTAGEQLVDTDHEFLVGDRLAGGRAPAVALPAGQPGGDRLHRVLGVHPDLDRHGRVGGRQQPLQGGEFGDVVGGPAQRAGLPARRDLVVLGDHPGPARWSGVSLGGSVTGGHNTFRHGLDHAMRGGVGPSTGSTPPLTPLRPLSPRP